MRISTFDIGGTYIKHGIMEEGILTTLPSFPTEANLGVKHLVKRLGALIAEETAERPLSAVAISTRGQVDTMSGTILYDPPTVFPDYTGAPLRDLLKQELQAYDLKQLSNIPIIIENDANCMGLAEVAMGGAKNFPTCLCVVIGTGIGGVLIENGSVYHGSNYSAGEFGMMYLPNKQGGFTFFEDYAAVPALLQLANEEMALQGGAILTDGNQITQELEKENPVILQVAKEWARRVAMGLASLIHIFNPPCLILGGGIMENKTLFYYVCKETSSLLAPGFESIHITVASLGNQAGMLGAAYLAEQTLSQEEK